MKFEHTVTHTHIQRHTHTTRDTGVGKGGRRERREDALDVRNNKRTTHAKALMGE